MSWIQMLKNGENKAWDETRKRLLSNGFMSGQSELPEIIKVMSLNPEACQSVIDFHEAVTFGGSSLSERREQMISVVVSALNECHY